jgi:predicted GH43/DUF377 family glycosyl hydrolase
MTLFDKKIAWEKQGLIITPQKDLWWMQSHAMTPSLEILGGGLVKVYFSGRNADNVSHIGWALIDLAKPTEVQDYSREPVLLPGELGCFDDNGVTPSCVITVGGRTYLYFIGWNPGSTVRVHLFGGLAISQDGGRSFTRASRAPIIERCPANPFLNTAPFVLHEKGQWRMYYVAGVGWVHKDLPRYNIQTATSEDGIAWQRNGDVAIDFAGEQENALARPFVLHDEGRYKMWFAHKGEAYRMGYAESEDGLTWRRDDSFSGLEPSPEGWDSEMVEYAAVAKHDGRYFMFYNGNNYGYDGIGLAVGQ